MTTEEPLRINVRVAIHLEEVRMNVISGVAAFAYGVPSSIRSNIAIAGMAEEKSYQLGGALIFTQKDVRIHADHYPVEYVTETEGEPPPTLRMAREIVLHAKRRGIKELWIACARPHLWRCRRDLEYAIREARANITVKVCGRVFEVDESYWYCPDSTQPRTQTRKAWRGRERILELMPMFLYKRVAS